MTHLFRQEVTWRNSKQFVRCLSSRPTTLLAQTTRVSSEIASFDSDWMLRVAVRLGIVISGCRHRRDTKVCFAAAFRFHQNCDA